MKKSYIWGCTFLSNSVYGIISCLGGEYLTEQIDVILRNDSNYRGIVPSEERLYYVGEVKPIINEPVRGLDIYVIQSAYSPTLEDRSLNDNLMALCLTVQAAKKADSERVTALFPYLAYSRQERRSGKQKGRREPISAQFVADMIQASGAYRLITLDAHTEAIEGFYKISFDNIIPTQLIVPKILEAFDNNLKNTVMSTLDYGGLKRTRIYSDALELPPPVQIHKIKDKEGNVEEETLIGDVRDKNVITIDDMIDRAGTIKAGVKTLKFHGALMVTVACSLPLFTGPALDRLDNLWNNGEGDLLGVIGTDAVWHGESFTKKHPWYSYVELAPHFAKVIRTIQAGGSLHEILDHPQNELPE